MTCVLRVVTFLYTVIVNINNINGRDVQTKNVVNNVDMSCLRAP